LERVFNRPQEISAIILCRDGKKVIERESASLFVSIDVELAMKTLAQKEKGHAVHVKVVSAPGAPGESRHCGEDTKKYHPDHKNRGRNVERSCQTKSRPHCRQVGKNHYPQKPAALPDFFQTRAELR